MGAQENVTRSNNLHKIYLDCYTLTLMGTAPGSMGYKIEEAAASALGAFDASQEDLLPPRKRSEVLKGINDILADQRSEQDEGDSEQASVETASNG